MRCYLFVAIDRNTHLITIGEYSKSGIKGVVMFLRPLRRLFRISHKLRAYNAARFTDRVGHGHRRPSGKHLFDMASKERDIEHRLASAFYPQTGGMVERFNRKVSQLFKPVYFENQQGLNKTTHGQANHYNRRQSQPTIEDLTPLNCWNQLKGKGKKLKVRSPDRGEPGDPEGTRVKSGNSAPDPIILKRETREVQEHSITTCYP